MIHFDSFYHENENFLTKSEMKLNKFIIEFLSFITYGIGFVCAIFFYFFMFLFLTEQYFYTFSLFLSAYFYFFYLAYKEDKSFNSLYNEKKYFKFLFISFFTPLAIIFCAFNFILEFWAEEVILINRKIKIEGKTHIYTLRLSGKEIILNEKGFPHREDCHPAIYHHFAGGTSLTTEYYYQGQKYQTKDIDKKANGCFEEFKKLLKTSANIDNFN